jgi:hypothetical protein
MTIRFDLCHREQLRAFAEGFDRLAKRVQDHAAQKLAAD